jgi:hypothetical protein
MHRAFSLSPDYSPNWFVFMSRLLVTDASCLRV